MFHASYFAPGSLFSTLFDEANDLADLIALVRDKVDLFEPGNRIFLRARHETIPLGWFRIDPNGWTAGGVCAA